MISISDSSFYPKVIKEFNYNFGNVFVFDKFVVSEINHGVNFDYSHAQSIIEDVFILFNKTNGETINYISNRMNSYSVMASHWERFFNEGYLLNAYIVVSDKARFCNVSIEKLFFKRTITHFSELEMAINFVESEMVKMDS